MFPRKKGTLNGKVMVLIGIVKLSGGKGGITIRIRTKRESLDPL